MSIDMRQSTSERSKCLSLCSIISKSLSSTCTQKWANASRYPNETDRHTRLKQQPKQTWWWQVNKVCFSIGLHENELKCVIPTASPSHEGAATSWIYVVWCKARTVVINVGKLNCYHDGSQIRTETWIWIIGTTKFWTIDYVGEINRISKFGYDRF